MKIIGREDPETDRANSGLRAPLQHLVELLGPQRVRLADVRDASLERVAAVAVEDDAEVPRDITPADLPQEETLVEVVEEGAHRQSFTLAPPGRASQENRERSVQGLRQHADGGAQLLHV